MTAALRFELAKLFARRRTWVMLLLVNLIPLVCTLLLLLALPFSLGYREKLLVPGLTGFFSLGVYYHVYAFPLCLSILTAGLMAGEEGEGTLRTLFLTFQPRWKIVGAKLVALCIFALATYAVAALLFGLSLLCVYAKMSPDWWKAFDYPAGAVVRASLRWLPWAFAAQVALVGFLGLVNSLCRSTYGAVALSLALLCGLGVLVIILPQTAAMAGSSVALERALFPYHYTVPYDVATCQNLFFFGRIDLPVRWGERTLLLLLEGLLFWGLTLWSYGRRDVVS